MTTPAKAPPTWLAWLPVIATIVLIAGVLWAGGGRMNELDQHESRITKLEAKRDTDADKLDRINERTARIDAKLEILLPSNGEQRVTLK